MKLMTSQEVRESFLDFFEEQKHQLVESSSLVPANDPTLLFTNAGMVQFKDVFLGLDKRDYKRATTSQKCMRVSGKHNDLENVGPSPRHHTFFEMLGNFSFGDYFKSDAIRFAYDLLTKVYGLPVDRLVFTVYENDDEAYRIWVEEIGVDPKRVARMGPSTNFWQMADTGPCGPTSEIHWDKQPDLGVDSIIPMLIEEDDRFLEIWNLVFMQYNRLQADPQHTGQWDEPLPAPGVDTGMGLERIVAILQSAPSNYDTDLFIPIIKATQALTGDTDEEVQANYVPYRVIADHIRAAVFLISDGVLPGAKGRASVCRLVIRRAARFGTKLGFNAPFLSKIADSVIDIMGNHYTDLVEQAEQIKKVITLEEERFHRTLERGILELDQMLDALDANGTLAGEQAFYLKATLGLPIQVTKDIVEERGYQVDMDGYLAAEEAHSLVSGGGQAMGSIASGELYNQLKGDLIKGGQLTQTGVQYKPYEGFTSEGPILAILREGEIVEQAIAGDQVEIVLGNTHFYVEAGGQQSDTGIIKGDGWLIEVESMRQPIGGLIVHMGEVIEGRPKVGDAAQAEVNQTRRANITRNHTGTHLLHAALRKELGKHVQQKGSLVAPDRLRFDFSHPEKVDPTTLKKIEKEINAHILANYPVRYEVKSLEQARNEGAMALFGEKYGDTVRTVVIEQDGDLYSYELCGGVHVAETAEIGSFIFTNETSVSAGIRRVEALTGTAAVEYINHKMAQLEALANQLGSSPDLALKRLEGLQEELHQSRKQVNELQRKLARFSFNEKLEQLETIQGAQVLIDQLQDIPMDTMREMSDWFRNKVQDNSVLILGSNINDKPQLLVVVSDDLIKRGLKAGDLVSQMAKIVGGGGGGRPNMAQAGGNDASKLEEALNKGRQIIAEVLS